MKEKHLIYLVLIGLLVGGGFIFYYQSTVPFLVSGDIENCSNLNKKFSYVVEFWIYNPDASDTKVFVDNNELKISKDSKYAEGSPTCIIGGEITPWGEGAIRATLDSYTGPGLVRIQTSDGKALTHRLPDAEGRTRLLINLSSNHKVAVTTHSYSSYQLRGLSYGGPSSKEVEGLGFIEAPSGFSSDEIFKFGQTVPSSISVRTRRGMPAPSTTRLSLSATPFSSKRD
jgi:hypothetical protein